jgi:hypothetical protein
VGFSSLVIENKEPLTGGIIFVIDFYVDLFEL